MVMPSQLYTILDPSAINFTAKGEKGSMDPERLDHHTNNDRLMGVQGGLYGVDGECEVLMWLRLSISQRAAPALGFLHLNSRAGVTVIGAGQRSGR
ncbi:hypothetical protein PCASD_11214 [Puccinia coronata f. sp. avenae]|uniref:Uncharacterized protein n=1 Tax=Puccinia coronata f. sp. avenae TaxID=200324 RepID=A0A2N5S867_9BASI|nr:hypothetical protein PCASD_21018 [Puccinia coronata f. sp. avenae]PLW36452.1 hypothetical protein PCASD_11214 [Puccinia coronata f. sp. avenae]